MSRQLSPKVFKIEKTFSRESNCFVIYDKSKLFYVIFVFSYNYFSKSRSTLHFVCVCVTVEGSPEFRFWNVDVRKKSALCTLRFSNEFRWSKNNFL